MKEKDALDIEVKTECSSPDVGLGMENIKSDNELITDSETVIETQENQSEEKISRLEKYDKGSTNGSISELTLELDYEEDIPEKVEDLKSSKDDVEEGLICTSDNVMDNSELEEQKDSKSRKKNKEEGESDDKDEGEISDDDDMDNELEDGDIADEEDLEEGEVKEAVLPTNQQTRQICRFFNNGNCTWGNQCRFLHLSLKDHGCYNMFASDSKAFMAHAPPGMDMPLRMPPVHGPMKTREFHRPPPLPPPPPVNKPNPPIQTAWDYSLACAKEVMEIANERKKQELDYEEKKLHLSAEENFQIGVHNKENYNYTKVSYQPPNNKPAFNKHEESNFREKSQPRSRKSWSEQENVQGPMRRNNWRDRQQFTEVEATARSRGDEWRDPWRRSLTPKHRQKRKREYSSESSVSSHSYSSHSSSYSYTDSSRASSASSRSPSFERIYNPNKVSEKGKRGKVSPVRGDTNPSVPVKGKPPYNRKPQKRSGSVLSQDKGSPYRSYSSSRSRSRSQSLSNVSSASSYSSWSRSSQTRDLVQKKEEVKPPSNQKHASGRPTRTLFEEMQRLVRYRDLSDGNTTTTTTSNTPAGTSITTNQPVIPKKKIKKERVSPAKETVVPVKEEKVKLEHAKSIGVRRIKLMKQLQAVEDAIARKRTKFN